MDIFQDLIKPPNGSTLKISVESSLPNYYSIYLAGSMLILGRVSHLQTHLAPGSPGPSPDGHADMLQPKEPASDVPWSSSIGDIWWNQPWDLTWFGHWENPWEWGFSNQLLGFHWCHPIMRILNMPGNINQQIQGLMTIPHTCGLCDRPCSFEAFTWCNRSGKWRFRTAKWWFVIANLKQACSQHPCCKGGKLSKWGGKKIIHFPPSSGLGLPIITWLEQSC